jgi:hypothetical protein
MFHSCSALDTGGSCTWHQTEASTCPCPFLVHPIYHDSVVSSFPSLSSLLGKGGSNAEFLGVLAQLEGVCLLFFNVADSNL